MLPTLNASTKNTQLECRTWQWGRVGPGFVATLRAYFDRPKPEAGSLLQPHFNLLFCSGRVFRGYSQRLQEQMRGGFGGAIPGLWKAFFFVFQAALLSPLVAINTWNRYAGLECTADQLVLASDFLHHLLHSMMDSVIPVKWWDCPSKRTDSHFSMWQSPRGIMTAAEEEVRMFL